MIPGFELIQFITIFGVLGVAAIVFAESGLLIGFFLPGDSLLFTAGFLTHQGVIDISIHALVAILFVAAALGDSVGYAFGKRVGPKIFRRPDSLLFKKENVEKAAAFYDKHGPKTIVIARFIPIVRTFAPIVAGISRMDYKQFLMFNLAGAALWAVGLTYLGYYAGAWFESHGLDVDHYLLPIIAVIVLLSVLPPIIHILKDASRRRAIIDSAKSALQKRRKK